MSKRRIILSIIISICVIWTAFFITDLVRCKNDKEPIFCVEIAQYKDGGSTKHLGLFYNYYRVKKIDEDTALTDYVITPWFFGLDYAKAKAFDK